MRLGVLGIIVATLSGCATFFVPDTRTPVDRARELDARCRSESEERAAPLLVPNVVDSVEPSYSYVKAGSLDRAARLRGAKLHLRPVRDYSREGIARSLECHQARVVLHREQPPLDDPYTLPDRWVDLDVDSEGDGFVVQVRSDEFEAARTILARANRFVAPR